MLTCFNIAKYFLVKTDEDCGDLISNLKLQKLVYYAQGFHLALFDKPLFEEKIEAWAHGPVIPALYREYKQFGSKAIPIPDDLDLSIYDQQTKDLLDEVYAVFGQFSAWKLRNMTHKEPTWKDAADYNGEISHQAMKNYFITQINND
jgi:uncharacterized phage-associated protein